MDAGLVAADVGEEHGERGFDHAQLLAVAEAFTGRERHPAGT